MIVSELIQMLQKCPQDAPVLAWDDQELFELSKTPAVVDVWFSEEHGHEHPEHIEEEDARDDGMQQVESVILV